jgi:hypothetical protein
MPMPMGPRSAMALAAEAARVAGQKTFDWPEPCLHGHLAPRRAGNWACSECVRLGNAERRRAPAEAKRRDQAAGLTATVTRRGARGVVHTFKVRRTTDTGSEHAPADADRPWREAYSTVTPPDDVPSRPILHLSENYRRDLWKEFDDAMVRELLLQGFISKERLDEAAAYALHRQRLAVDPSTSNGPTCRTSAARRLTARWRRPHGSRSEDFGSAAGVRGPGATLLSTRCMSTTTPCGVAAARTRCLRELGKSLSRWLPSWRTPPRRSLTRTSRKTARSSRRMMSGRCLGKRGPLSCRGSLLGAVRKPDGRSLSPAVSPV